MTAGFILSPKNLLGGTKFDSKTNKIGVTNKLHSENK